MRPPGKRHIGSRDLALRVWCAAALLALVGCSSHPRLVKPPRPPPAAHTEWLVGTGGVQLYASTRLPAAEPAAVLYFVVGPEVSSREAYPQFVAAARAQGMATVDLHPRGTGYSDGLRGDIEDFALFLADLRAGLSYAQKRFPATPIFLFGHSAGGSLALQIAATTQAPIAGVVLVNPTYKLTYAEGMGPSIGDYVRFGVNSVFRPAALTVDMNSNPAAVEFPADRAESEAMQRDPLVVRYFSMRFMSGWKTVIDACVKNAAARELPLLVIQGANDALVDPRGTDEILAAAPTRDKRKLIAAEGGHGSSAVETEVDAIVQWLQAHARPSLDRAQ